MPWGALLDLETTQMNKILALGLAAAVATATVTAVSSEASANPYWMMHPHPQMMYHPHSYFGFGGAPFFFGFPLGRQFAPYPYPNYAYYNNPHVTWCLQHYRTYNPSTNTFFIKKGVPAVCVAPFDY